ncbi:MAG: NADPH-dependent F420 reductase [Acidimicrobiales bacterium]
MTVGVLGGTGPAGRAAAAQLAAIGKIVVVGSRDLARAEEAVKEVQSAWPDRDLDLRPGTNEAAAEADMVVVAVPWEGVLSTLEPLAALFDGKIVISMVNALTRWGRSMVPLIVPTGSVAVAVARALPGARVVAAFHHLPAGQWADLDSPLQADVLVCSDNLAATAEVIALISGIPGLRGVDAGTLASAMAIESLTPVLLEVNRRHKTHASLRLTGLGEP